MQLIRCAIELYLCFGLPGTCLCKIKRKPATAQYGTICSGFRGLKYRYALEVQVLNVINYCIWQTVLLMGFIYDTEYKYSRTWADNLFPNILTQAPVCIWGIPTLPGHGWKFGVFLVYFFRFTSMQQITHHTGVHAACFPPGLANPGSSVLSRQELW